MSDDPLDKLNRFIIVGVALAGMFIALLVVLLAWGASDESITRIVDFASYLRRHNDRESKVVVSLASAVVILLMLTAMIVELTPSPRQNMRVRNMKSGAAAITTAQIAERINAEVLQVPHIAECAAMVAARGKRVEVVLDLHVDAGADLARTADEACRRSHVLVEERLGIEMAAMPRARLHYRELRLRGEGAASALERHGPSGRERPRTTEGELDQQG